MVLLLYVMNECKLDTFTCQRKHTKGLDTCLEIATDFLVCIQICWLAPPAPRYYNFLKIVFPKAIPQEVSVRC